MKEIVIRTLTDLGSGFGLYGYCEACGRMERLERGSLQMVGQIWTPVYTIYSVSGFGG